MIIIRKYLIHIIIGKCYQCFFGIRLYNPFKRWIYLIPIIIFDIENINYYYYYYKINFDIKLLGINLYFKYNY